MRVYCIDCKFLGKSCYNNDICEHPVNIVRLYGALKEEISYERIEAFNSKNDCKSFVPKFFKRGKYKEYKKLIGALSLDTKIKE